MDRHLFIINLIRQFEYIVSLYNTIEKTTYSYGTDSMLHPSEIHMIAAIGDHADSNLTELSRHLNITKGATTKMAQKLVKKGLVIKQFAPNSENEVVLSLTSVGRKAYSGHRAYRINLINKLSDVYTNVPDDLLVRLKDIGSETEKILNTITMERIHGQNNKE